jgi:hypothetical protein
VGVDVIDAPEFDNALVVNVRYLIKDTHDERSIVYPFYILDEQ